MTRFLFLTVIALLPMLSNAQIDKGSSDILIPVALNEEWDKWGFIDKRGNVVVPFKYDWVDKFSEGLACVELNGKYGCIDKQGNVVVPIKYDKVDDFSENVIVVGLNGKYGCIDKQGNVVVPLKYGWVGYPPEEG